MLEIPRVMNYFGNDRLSVAESAYRKRSFDTPQRRLLQLGGNNVCILRS